MLEQQIEEALEGEDRRTGRFDRSRDLGRRILRVAVVDEGSALPRGRNEAAGTLGRDVSASASGASRRHVHEPGEREPRHGCVGVHERRGPVDLDRREAVRDSVVDREARGAYLHSPRPLSFGLVDDGHFDPGPHPKRPFHHPLHPLFKWALWVDPTDLGCPARPSRRVGEGGPHRRRAHRPSDFDASAHAPNLRQPGQADRSLGVHRVNPCTTHAQSVRPRMGSEAPPTKERAQ